MDRPSRAELLSFLLLWAFGVWSASMLDAQLARSWGVSFVQANPLRPAAFALPPQLGWGLLGLFLPVAWLCCGRRWPESTRRAALLLASPALGAALYGELGLSWGIADVWLQRLAPLAPLAYGLTGWREGRRAPSGWQPSWIAGGLLMLAFLLWDPTASFCRYGQGGQLVLVFAAIACTALGGVNVLRLDARRLPGTAGIAIVFWGCATWLVLANGLDGHHLRCGVGLLRSWIA